MNPFVLPGIVLGVAAFALVRKKNGEKAREMIDPDPGDTVAWKGIYRPADLDAKSIRDSFVASHEQAGNTVRDIHVGDGRMRFKITYGSDPDLIEIGKRIYVGENTWIKFTKAEFV